MCCFLRTWYHKTDEQGHSKIALNMSVIDGKDKIFRLIYYTNSKPNEIDYDENFK